MPAAGAHNELCPTRSGPSSSLGAVHGTGGADALPCEVLSREWRADTSRAAHPGPLSLPPARDGAACGARRQAHDVRIEPSRLAARGRARYRGSRERGHSGPPSRRQGAVGASRGQADYGSASRLDQGVWVFRAWFSARPCQRPPRDLRNRCATAACGSHRRSDGLPCSSRRSHSGRRGSRRRDPAVIAASETSGQLDSGRVAFAAFNAFARSVGSNPAGLRSRSWPGGSVPIVPITPRSRRPG